MSGVKWGSAAPLPMETLERWAREICPSDPLDTGIVRAVKLLRDAGFDTFEACQGASPGERHAYAEPTVRFEGTADDALRAADLCLQAGKPIAYWTAIVRSARSHSAGSRCEDGDNIVSGYWR